MRPREVVAKSEAIAGKLRQLILTLIPMPGHPRLVCLRAKHLVRLLHLSLCLVLLIRLSQPAHQLVLPVTGHASPFAACRGLIRYLRCHGG